jgi:hypothetical protein
MKINHPTKIIVPVETALREWNHAGGIVSEKKDGGFAVIQVEDFIITAEKVRGDGIYAFDLVAVAGQDIRNLPLANRWGMLNDRVGTLAENGIKIVPSVSSECGAAFLRSVLDAGGEGCVLKGWNASYFSPMLAAKRGGVWTCRVTGHVAGTQSVFIEDAETGEDRGKVTLRGGKCDQCRVDSLIRVAGMNLTSVGKIRQPQPAREWLVKL